jgi:hypothetical protein
MPFSGKRQTVKISGTCLLLLCLVKTLSGKEMNRKSDVLTVKEPFEYLNRLGLES